MLEVEAHSPARSLDMVPEMIEKPCLLVGHPLICKSHQLVEYPRECAKYLPTYNTSLFAGASTPAGRCTPNSRMPDTMGLTKYISKIE